MFKEVQEFQLEADEKYIARNIFMICAATALLFESACSPNRNDGSPALSSTVAEAATSTLIAVPSETTESFGEPVSAVVPFTAGNVSGAVAISGYGSPVAGWFANQPDEVPLDLVDADAADAVSVAEEMKRYISLAVYFAEGRQTKAEETLQAAEMSEIDQPISMPQSSLEKIKSNLLSVFDIRGFLSITTFIVSRQ